MVYTIDKDELVIYDNFEEFLNKSPLFEVFKKCNLENNWKLSKSYGVISREYFEQRIYSQHEIDIDYDLLGDIGCNDDGSFNEIIFCFDTSIKPFKLHLCSISSDGILSWILLNFRKEIEQRITENNFLYGIQQ
jgi:hypothetical protein